MDDSRKGFDNVVELRPGDLDSLALDETIPPDEVLEGALGKYTHVVVIGIRKEDQTISVRGSHSGYISNWLCDKAKGVLLDSGGSEDD